MLGASDRNGTVDGMTHDAKLLVPYALVQLARPQHWIKNLLVILPVIFARKLDDPPSWLLASLAMAAFCLASSATYALNDIKDRAADREHPLKRDRPVASGRLSPWAAGVASSVFMGGGVYLACLVSLPVAATVALYLLLQLAYTFDLKHRPILDVIGIAVGFVLRAIAGTFAIGVRASPWLIVCVFTLCLFLGFCKRWNEVAELGSGDRLTNHRKTLGIYTPELLTHLVTLSASVAIVAYLLYVVSPATVDHFGTDALVYTLPAVVYGVCRFAMISMQGRYSDPVGVLWGDKPLLATGILWLAGVVLIVAMGDHPTAGTPAGP
jgi:4-hydroxybenzoate polyprenyltransferase